VACKDFRIPHLPHATYFLAALCLCVSAVGVLRAQIETVESTPPSYVWISHGRLEGHLALRYSPAAAFSPDSTTLAVIVGDKIVLLDVANGGVRKALRPRLEGITEIEMQSASFLTPTRLFILGSGMFRAQGKGEGRSTPTLAFQWDTEPDTLFGKINVVGVSGGYGPPRYLPQSGHLAMFKESHFDLWHPASGRGGRIEIPALTQRPNLFEFSPDGQWLLLAQIELDSSRDPAVVLLKEKRFVDSLRGHEGVVQSLAFSRDMRRVLTACEDGKVRVWSAPEWKLLHTLAGHQGPVHWAEFSPDGARVVSGGQDGTVRIWSTEDGRLVQTLEDLRAPVRTVAFASNGEYVAASADNLVLVWRRVRAE